MSEKTRKRLMRQAKARAAAREKARQDKRAQFVFDERMRVIAMERVRFERRCMEIDRMLHGPDESRARAELNASRARPSWISGLFNPW